MRSIRGLAPLFVLAGIAEGIKMLQTGSALFEISEFF
jgi:hypothetical protein